MENRYVISHALTSLAHQSDSKEDLAKCVFDEIREKLGGIRDESEMNKQITGLNVVNEISLFDWGVITRVVRKGIARLWVNMVLIQFIRPLMRK